MTLPNQLTILRIVLTPVYLFLFLSGNPLLKQLSLIVFFIAALSDWYDGWLARKFNYITDWGKFMDPLADKILTSTAFIGFAVIGMLDWWMVIIIVVRDLVITLLRAFADKKGFIFSTSYYAKLKTFFQMVFLYYLLVFYIGSISPQLNQKFGNFFNIVLDEKLIYFIMLIITLITLHTGFLYFKRNKRVIKRIISG